MMIWRSLDNALLVKMLRSLMPASQAGTGKPVAPAQPNPPKHPAE